MFTGIIESEGEIQSIEQQDDAKKILINCDKFDLSDVAIGDSIAVNGVCLTVSSLANKGFYAFVSNETISRTGFKHYQQGQIVNLEKALQLSSRMGGHLVSGHVDGIGVIDKIMRSKSSWDFLIKAPFALIKYIAQKGSICVDGVSLTVNEVSGELFRLTIVPHTLENTLIRFYKVGTEVNLEVDIIARYLESLIRGGGSELSSTAITREFLGQYGFMK